jgi:hypothetical protein
MLRAKKDWSFSMAEQAANTTPRAEGRRPRNPRGGRRDDRRNVRDDAPKEFEELEEATHMSYSIAKYNS